MITEDYVSFELAKLLKEKRFDKDFDADIVKWYNVDKEDQNLFSLVDHRIYKCPSLAMMMKWLREVHNWTICISPYWPEGDMRNKLTWYYDIHSLIDNRSFKESSYTDNYTKACEAAIKYCLEHLI